MNVNKLQSTYSRKRASLGLVSFNQMNYSNPWVIMGWSFFFPGFGHIMLGEYIQGWMLFLWEVFVNVKAHFNTAIVYALTGRFSESINDLTSGGEFWILLYSTVFCYSLYGSYHLSVELNNMYSLAYEENVPVEIFKINSFQINFINKRNPWNAALWSLLMPGLGELYSRKFTSSLFVLTWWIIIAYYSHFLPCFVYSLTGQFEWAVSVINPEWMMFLPSIYGFSFYNSYISIVEQNKLFDKQQQNYLKTLYQPAVFPFHLKKEDNKMRIISTFDHSLYLEKAIVSIEKQGIPKDKIFAVPMKKNQENKAYSLDTMHSADGISFLDLPSLSAAFFCALGTIYGFVLKWGPVVWGLTGFFGGFLIGAMIKIIILKISMKNKTTNGRTEVVLMIVCEKEMANKVEQILWKNQAFGVSKVE